MDNQKKIRSPFIPTQEQLNSLLTLVKGTRMEIAVLLAAFMGLRPSEICALTPSDYNEENHTLTINKEMVRNDLNIWVVKPPKTYSGNRTLPVPDAVAHVLQPNPFPICMNPAMISEQYMRLKEKIGFSVRFHDLRHYYASLLLVLNVPDKYAMELMGLAAPNMLKNVHQRTMEDIYLHTTEDKQKSVSNAINQAISNIMQNKTPCPAPAPDKAFNKG